jgi:hypothetical protein
LQGEDARAYIRAVDLLQGLRKAAALYAHAGIKASGAVTRPSDPMARLRRFGLAPLLGLYGLFETELEFFQSRLLCLALLLDGCSFYLTQMQRRY